MTRVFSGPLFTPPADTVVFDTGAVTAGGDADLGTLSISVDGPANLRLEVRDSTNTATLAGFTFVVAEDIRVFDVATYTFPLQPNERIRLVLTSNGVRFLQASMTYRIVKRFVLNQGGAGTTVIAAAVPGAKHSVLGCILSPNGGGISTVRFSDGAGFLMGPYRVPGGAASGLVWDGPVVLCQTAVNSPLNVVSAADGYSGIVLFVTET